MLVTPKALKGPDPQGPDEGRIEFKVKAGEAIVVFPKDMVKRYGVDKLKAFFESWKAHSRMKDVMGPVPKVKRKAAMA